MKIPAHGVKVEHGALGLSHDDIALNIQQRRFHPTGLARYQNASAIVAGLAPTLACRIHLIARVSLIAFCLPPSLCLHYLHGEPTLLRSIETDQIIQPLWMFAILQGLAKAQQYEFRPRRPEQFLPSLKALLGLLFGWLSLMLAYNLPYYCILNIRKNIFYVNLFHTFTIV